MLSYLSDARSDACDLVENFMDQIVEKLVNVDEASDDWNNDYEDGDSYFHESFVDREYSFREAGELIEELSEYEETDGGLWEGRDMKDAVSTCAAFTYGKAVWCQAEKLMERINRRALDMWGEWSDLEAEHGVEMSHEEKEARTTDMIQTQIARFRG